MVEQNAEKLLVHKEPLECPHLGMPARITGTVVLAFVIDKKGNVQDAKVVSGPALLRPAVLRAVQKYKYKPLLLNNTAVEVLTTVTVNVDTYRDCAPVE